MKKIKSVLQGTLLVLLISSCNDNDRYNIYDDGKLLLDKKTGHIWHIRHFGNESRWVDFGVIPDENNKVIWDIEFAGDKK
jgi:hypothetical protein